MTGTTIETDEFKMTELGPLPSEWEVVRLGNVAYFETGRRMKGGALENGEILSLGGEHISNSGDIDLRKPKFISKEFYNGLSKGKLRDDDIIICKDGAKTGKVAYIKLIHGQYMAVNEHVFIVRSKDDRALYNQFIFYFLFSSLGQSQVREAYHGLIGGVTNSDISNFKILLPSLSEQKRIAYVLSSVQIAIEKTEVVIKAARELKKSLMKHLFTYGSVSIGEAENVPLKETEISPVPEHWQQTELGQIADIVYGVQAAVANLTDSSIGIPILTNINVRNDGMLDISTLRYYPLPENKRDKLILKKGDVLFNWRSGSPLHVGKTAIFNLDGDYTFSSFILRFRSCTDSASNEYLFRYLNLLKSSGFFLSKRSQSSVNSVFNASLAAKIPILLPSTLDQIKISSMLSSADRKIQVEENKKQALEALFKTLLTRFMTGKIRVSSLEVPV